MMTQAFYSGVSGLKVYSDGINVVSDNLANVSTTGFRAYDAEYSTLFETTLSSASANLMMSNNVGVGVQVQATTMSEEQGTLMLTDKNTDLAIMGEGWFGVEANGEKFYTRNGDFLFDSQNSLVTNEGYHVLGTLGDNISEDNVLTKNLDSVAIADITQQEALHFPSTLTYPTEPTSKAKFTANLGVGDEGYETITMAASVIDPQSNRNNLKLTFTKSQQQTPPGSQWDVVAKVTSADGKIEYAQEDGVVTFDETGALSSSTLTVIDNNGAPVEIDLGSGYDGIISMDTPVFPGSSTADGTMGGTLEEYSINQNGEVIASFSNGKQSSVGRVSIFHFQNDQGLERIDATRFAQSVNSGDPLIYTNSDGENILGATIRNSQLESSNVDTSVALTNLIILQRAYDANSKSVTTADQMIQKALSMDA